MLPVLLRLGPVKIYTLPIFIVLGLLLGLFVIWKRGKELHFEEQALFDVVFRVLLFGVIGARVGFILIHLTMIQINVGDWLNVMNKPGYYLPLGVLIAWLALLKMTKKRKWDAYQLGDILATGFSLTQAIYCLGAFVAGFGYGLPTNSIIGVRFMGLLDRRIPVQIFECIAYVGLFSYLWWVESVYRTFSWYRKNRSQAATGFIVAMYLILSSLFSLVATMLRSPELVWFNIRFDLVIDGLMLLFGIWLLSFRSNHRLLEIFNFNKHKAMRVERFNTITKEIFDD